MHRSIVPFALITFACASTFLIAPGHAEVERAQRTVIHSQSELPAYSYKIATPTASALLDDDAALLGLAEAVRKDAEATLAKYEITDSATLRDLYGAIRDAALIRGDAESVLEYSAKVRELAGKPAEKLTSGLRGDAAAAAMAAGDDPKMRQAAFQKTFAASIKPLPWAVVRDDMMVWNGQFKTHNMGTVMRGGVAGILDAVVERSGQISWEAARGLMNVAIYLRRIEPYVAQATAVLGEFINAHKQVKPDILAERKVALDPNKQRTATLDTHLFGVGFHVSRRAFRVPRPTTQRVDSPLLPWFQQPERK